MRYKKLYKQLAALLEKGDFFVNLGANDGVTNDPIYDFIQPFELMGIAVEPIEITYKKLCENYALFSGVMFERSAIYVGNTSPMYRLCDKLLVKYPVLTQATSKDKFQLIEMLNNFISGGADPGFYEKVGLFAVDDMRAVDDLLVIDTDVSYLTFDQLISKYKVEKIDFLNIDIEGLDFDVFMELNLERWRPKVMVIETRLFTNEQSSIFSQKIKDSGYKFLQNFDYYSEVFIQG